jgi:hypothetical protein
MKQLLVLSAMCVALVGCDTTKGFMSPQPTEKPVKPSGSYRAPIVADQVNPENAKDKAKALNDEMDRDLQAAIEARDKAK